MQRQRVVHSILDYDGRERQLSRAIVLGEYP